MGKALILLTYLLGLATCIVAQTDSTVFVIDPQQDFGSIAMRKKPVDLLYTIVNGSQSSVWLKAESPHRFLKVRLDSGQLQSGDSAMLILSFDTWKHPGKVSYEIPIGIQHDEMLSSIRVRIKGEVLADQNEIERLFPFGTDQLRVTRDHLSFGNVKENASVSLNIYNAGDTTLQLEVLKPLNEPFTLHLPDSVEPNGTREISIEYLNRNQDYGVFNDRFDLKVKGDSVSIPIRTNGMAIPNFQVEESNPEISMVEDLLDLGSVSSDELLTGSMTIANTGEAVLEILKIQTNCNCVMAKVEESQIKPGEEVPLKIVFDPANRRDRQYKSIYLYTNDPLTPVKVVYLKAHLR